ncbi:PEP-CTERM sorting domain-containing protein [Botrimarina sp.]|uniref:PEP-CTERM sorting domain-containing protein n=1 Tax=Botrimarina sp. TaxID=2795802 RepID=UPI0032ED16E6
MTWQLRFSSLTAALVLSTLAASTGWAVSPPYSNDFLTDISDFTLYSYNEVGKNDGMWTWDQAQGELVINHGIPDNPDNGNNKSAALVSVPAGESDDLLVSTTMTIPSVGPGNNMTFGIASRANTIVIDNDDSATGPPAAEYYYFDWRPNTGRMRIRQVVDGTDTQLNFVTFQDLPEAPNDNRFDYVDERDGSLREFAMSMSVVDVADADGAGTPGVKITGTLTAWGYQSDETMGVFPSLDTWTIEAFSTDVIQPLNPGDPLYYGLRTAGAGNFGGSYFQVNFDTFDLSVVPEPSTLASLAVLGCLAGARRVRAGR